LKEESKVEFLLTKVSSMKGTCTWTELRCRLDTVEDPLSRKIKGSLKQKNNRLFMLYV